MRQVWLLCCFIFSGLCNAGGVLKIAGQEGDEKFFNLIAAIYQEMGFAVEFRLVPAARALSLVNAGQFDAEVGRVPEMTDKYPNLFYAAEPLLDVQLVALVKKGTAIELKSAADLRGKRIGFLIGMSVAELYSKKHSLKAISVPTHVQLAKMLALDRLDVVLMGSAFSQSPVYTIADPALVLSTASVYHIVHQKHAALTPRFDAILMAMKKDGRYTRLLQAAPAQP